MLKYILAMMCAAAVAVGTVSSAAAQTTPQLQGTPRTVDQIPLALPAGTDAPPAAAAGTAGPLPQAPTTWVQTGLTRRIVGQGPCATTGPSATHLCVTVEFNRTMEPIGQPRQASSPPATRLSFRNTSGRVRRVFHPMMGCPSSGCLPSQPTLSEWNCVWRTRYDGTGWFTVFSVGMCSTIYYNWYTAYRFGAQYQICTNLYNSVVERFQCEAPPTGQFSGWSVSTCTTLELIVPPYASPQPYWVCGADEEQQTTKVDEQVCAAIACSTIGSGTVSSTLIAYPKNGYWYGSTYEADNFK